MTGWLTVAIRCSIVVWRALPCSGRDVENAELVADRVQAVDQPTQRGPAARQHRDRGVDVGADGGQVVDGDLVQAGLPGHADRRQRGEVSDLLCKQWLPI